MVKSPSPFTGASRVYISEFAQAICYALFTVFFFGTSIWRDDYVNYNLELPALLLLSAAFGFHLFIHKLEKSQLYASGYFLNVIVIGLLVVLFQSFHSVFLIVSILNVVLAAFVLGTRSAVEVAVFSAGVLNFVLVSLRPEMAPQFWATAMVYDTSLVVTAVLGGLLSREMRSLGQELEKRTTDLKLAQNINELMIENMASGLLAISADGEIVSANKGAAKIFETLGLKGRALNEISVPLWDLVQKVTNVDRSEVQHRSIKGNPILLEVVTSRMMVESEKIMGWIVLLQNVTEIRNLERELKQNEKLAAVGQLAAGIAHEIRNPLASISGSVQLLAGTLDAATPEDKKLLAIIIKEIDRLNDLISEFLEYVRPSVEATDPIDMNALMSEILEMARVNERLSAGVSVQKEMNATTQILGHYDKLKQAFLNIVINAYQAMEKSAEKQLKVRTYENDGEVVVEIVDSGPGIPSDHIHRIFEPFHTTKPKGSGLGLAITYKILESHGARIEVESAVGRGAFFRIRFPVNKDLKSST